MKGTRALSLIKLRGQRAGDRPTPDLAFLPKPPPGCATVTSWPCSCLCRQGGVHWSGVRLASGEGRCRAACVDVLFPHVRAEGAFPGAGGGEALVCIPFPSLLEDRRGVASGQHAGLAL